MLFSASRVTLGVDVKVMLDPPTHLSLSLMTSSVLDLSGEDLFIGFPVACLVPSYMSLMLPDQEAIWMLLDSWSLTSGAAHRVGS